ncbi:Woronin body protein HexA, putative [Talaromyces marneffei ATCC 18224]|uniref:Woronin body protein HexA, putative n=1 Tax=Talaromyces marneffei (strain ATCC 18224 / CBS 334.59 / QM 7333) TaxID=441960 RepID=B6QDY9_TALMQ|nr:Woronin body protein HexA, putative [Talaromyces marneffei ATCC 18224]
MQQKESGKRKTESTCENVPRVISQAPSRNGIALFTSRSRLGLRCCQLVQPGNFPFERHSRKDAQRTVNLDFEARVPIPFSVFPSSYRSDAVSETTQTRVEEEVEINTTSRVGREDTVGAPLPDPRVYGKEEVDVRIRTDDRRPHSRYEETRVYEERDRFYDNKQSNYPQVELSRERNPRKKQAKHNKRWESGPHNTVLRTAVQDHCASPTPHIHQHAPSCYPRISPWHQYLTCPNSFREPIGRYEEYPTSDSTTTTVTQDRAYETQLDVTERDFRRRIQPTYEVDVTYDRRYQPETAAYRADAYDVTPEGRNPYNRSTQVSVTKETIREEAPKSKMGYYDDEGHYHSFRRGVERAADRLLHPFHHDREEVVVEAGAPRTREEVRVIEPRGGVSSKESVPIPVHFIRVGDLLILQGRPCQVIRVSVSPQTGQHRYLGVDLFTRQLHEESSFISNPSPSVVVQTMLGPVYKTYRVLDVHDDGFITAMTETGDVKQSLPVISQGGLFQRIRQAYSEGRGSVRALVINDGGRELVVDYKVIHGSRL